MSASPVDDFLPEIFEREAKGYLADALAIPAVILASFRMDREQSLRAARHVASIFEQSYLGGVLKVVGMVQDRKLYGYALVFVDPRAPDAPVYLHKIYVPEAYRGIGIGSQMLECIRETWADVALLCPPHRIAFYKAQGFTEHGREPLQDDKFVLSRDLYNDLTLMSNSTTNTSAPIFLLNDDDLYAAMGIPR